MRKIKRILFRVRDEPLEKINAPAKARTFITERKGRAFVFDKSRKFIIAKALPDVNTIFSERRAIFVPIFKEIKEHLTARQVAEYYGLRVGRNGMVCCPFHDDKHPSMKIDTGYYCFGCGAHGDAIGYVAQMYGMSQYDAACKLIEDFSLPIEMHPTDERDQEKARMKWRKEKEERDKIVHIKERFKKWCFAQIDILHDAENGIQQIKDSFWNATPDEVFGSPEFEAAVNAEPLIGYWLDILCMGTDEERIELFMKGRGEVERYVRKVAGAVERRLERSRTDTGYGMQQCG